MKLRISALCLPLLFAACADDTVDSGSANVTAKQGGQFELYESRADGQLYFRLKAKNGEIILASEGYRARAGVERGILSTLRNGVQADAYQLLPASGGGWYFNLRAANGQVVGTSEVYSSKQAAKKGRSTVMGYLAGGPRIDDWANQCGANLFRGADDRLYFNLLAANGQVVLSSQGYQSEAGAKKGIASALSNGVDAAAYQLKPSSDGGYYFTVRAGNNEVVGQSEVYSSKSAAETGKQVVMNVARAQADCVAGWNDDGDADTGLVCEGDWGHPLLGDVSYELADFVTSTVEVTLDNFESTIEPNSLTERQIRWAANHNGGIDFGADFEEVMQSVDEDTFYIKQVAIGTAEYTWVKYYAGDTEVGIVFADGTDRAIVRISDGDIQNCDIASDDVLQHGDECGAADECAPGLFCSGLTVGYSECRPNHMAGSFASTAGSSIADDASSTENSIDVAGLASVPEDVIVTLDIDHPRPQDLTVALHQPGGGYEVLWDGETDPKSKLSAGWGIERDNMVNGTWTLEIIDNVSGEAGTLNGWSLYLSSRWD